MKTTKAVMVRQIVVATLWMFGCGGQRVEAAGSAESYRLETVLPRGGVAGKPQVVRVTVTPVGDWKINKQFPTELKVEAPASVQMHQSVQRAKDAVVLRDDRLEFQIAATPTQTGEYALTLTFKFGLCRKSECIWRTERVARKLRAR